MVPQETYLFSGTIYENLVAANPNAGFGDVVQACKIAEIHETIEKLPQGYNTVIGEHGVGLWGAEAEAGDCAGGAEKAADSNFR